ncbi:hypothetical protein [Actinomadura opuntiae]|uniref:hypothetical protein n=1 Tax=Actinomadura sp. OS1-43 TaxID=604315 RepID=UPI00255B3ABA|nr:hypothetical protein [Actinomadura sp. OS1-43]MDL4821819.1 hypothetical protein [Actinomadura sp. OS1-43]
MFDDLVGIEGRGAVQPSGEEFDEAADAHQGAHAQGRLVDVRAEVRASRLDDQVGEGLDSVAAALLEDRAAGVFAEADAGAARIAGDGPDERGDRGAELGDRVGSCRDDGLGEQGVTAAQPWSPQISSAASTSRRRRSARRSSALRPP